MPDVSVTVAILTFRRTTLLSSCLRSVGEQTFGLSSTEILVVDNDEAESARPTVEAFASTTAVTVRYITEPRPGISAARNRAIAESRGAQYLAFLDDDEEADPEWLQRLLAGINEFDADVAQGFVASRLEAGGPGWAAKSGLFDRHRPVRGERLQTAGAGSVLIRRDSIPSQEFFFRDSLGLTGGEDTEMFARLWKLGVDIVAVPDAVAVEFVPLERQTISWILRRHSRSAAVRVLVMREVIRPRRWLAQRALAGIRNLISGLTLILLSAVPPSTHRLVRGLSRVASFWGTVLGLVRHVPKEYRRGP